MSCDIHIIAEIKEKGKWIENTEKVFKDWNGKPSIYPNDSRHYDWFSILAGVRNGHGFAGIKTGAGFSVICEPRGVPIDATASWLETVKDWDCDMHSHSYLTIQDFDLFDWNQITIKTGVILLSEYANVKINHEPPKSWCGGICGGNTITISQEEADIELKNPGSYGDKQIYVQYEWPVIYREWFKNELESVVEPLRKLTEKYGEARLVFGFDN